MNQSTPDPGALTHVNEQGEVQMVAIGDKQVSQRQATAQSVVTLPPAAAAIIAAGGDSAKGPVLTTARLAGIQGAKRCADLIPLCHPLPLDNIHLELSWQDPHLVISATISCHARTGVEMEALCAVSVAALTVYDMLKGVSHDIIIGPTELIAKSGGRSGDIKRSTPTLNAKAKPAT